MYNLITATCSVVSVQVKVFVAQKTAVINQETTPTDA